MMLRNGKRIAADRLVARRNGDRRLRAPCRHSATKSLVTLCSSSSTQYQRPLKRCSSRVSANSSARVIRFRQLDRLAQLSPLSGQYRLAASAHAQQGGQSDHAAKVGRPSLVPADVQQRECAAESSDGFIIFVVERRRRNGSRGSAEPVPARVPDKVLCRHTLSRVGRRPSRLNPFGDADPPPASFAARQTGRRGASKGIARTTYRMGADSLGCRWNACAAKWTSTRRKTGVTPGENCGHDHAVPSQESP